MSTRYIVCVWGGGGGTGEMPIMECVAVGETMKHGKRVSF